MTARTIFWCLLLALPLAACTVESPNESASPAHAHDADAHAEHEDGPLGTVRFPVTCDEEAAHHAARGLALLHHMTYEDARGAFAAATEIDPACAMGYWGQAMTVIHPLWSDPPSEDDFDHARALLADAADSGDLADWERAYIEAAQAYFAGGWDRDERRNLAAFAAGWEQVHQARPDDPEAASFYALGLLATADPADKTYDHQLRAGALAERVLEAIPDHPAGHHYAIHAYDVPALADRGLGVAGGYGEIAPAVPHALHMPSHIYTRLGHWADVIAWNERSAEVALERPVEHDISMHYFHALDYVAYAHLQQGEDAEAAAILDRVRVSNGAPHAHLGTAYTLAAVPARVALERQRWDEAAALGPAGPEDFPWDRFPQAAAITEFARALGAARSDDGAAARQALDRLQALADALAGTSAYWAEQVAIQRLAARAWLLHAEGREAEALAEMSAAADREAATDKHPVTPGEVLPASELLGEMLLAADRPGEALAAYVKALERSPRRLNGLYGAGRSAERVGDADAARRYYTTLLEVAGTAGADLGPVRHAKDYLSGT